MQLVRPVAFGSLGLWACMETCMGVSLYFSSSAISSLPDQLCCPNFLKFCRFLVTPTADRLAPKSTKCVLAIHGGSGQLVPESPPLINMSKMLRILRISPQILEKKKLNKLNLILSFYIAKRKKLLGNAPPGHPYTFRKVQPRFVHSLVNILKC